MSSREMFELEPGDTGEALLPVHKVNDKGAHEYDTASDVVVRCALAWTSGYSPELYERAMRRAKGDWS